MTAKITELIDKVDNFELIRDQIAAILLAESENQELLATDAGKDPKLWELRVYTERTNPWGDFENAPDKATPIVNVSFDSATYEMAASNTVERQKTTGLYNVDCYGYGISEDVTDEYEDGHSPGDAKAAVEAHRAFRLVRNILMAGHYTYLGFPRGSLVWRRWPQQVQAFKPESEGRRVQHVMAVRLQLSVEFNELSPQVQGQPFEILALTLKRSETGQVFFVAQYP